MFYILFKFAKFPYLNLDYLDVVFNSSIERALAQRAEGHKFKF